MKGGGWGYFPTDAKPYCSQVLYTWSEYGAQYGLIPGSVCWSVARYGTGPTNKADDCCIVGNPVHPALGNKAHREPVYGARVAPGPLAFEWLYSTNRYWSAVKTAGWSHTFNRAIRATTGAAFAYRENGFVATFTPKAGIYSPDADISDRLTRLVDGADNTTGWTYYVSKTEEETRDATGRLTAIPRPFGRHRHINL